MGAELVARQREHQRRDHEHESGDLRQERVVGAGGVERSAKEDRPGRTGERGRREGKAVERGKGAQPEIAREQVRRHVDLAAHAESDQRRRGRACCERISRGEEIRPGRGKCEQEERHVADVINGAVAWTVGREAATFAGR